MEKITVTQSSVRRCIRRMTKRPNISLAFRHSLSRWRVGLSLRHRSGNEQAHAKSGHRSEWSEKKSRYEQSRDLCARRRRRAERDVGLRDLALWDNHPRRDFLSRNVWREDD